MVKGPVIATASIFFISLLGIPASYVVNRAHTTQGELGLVIAGTFCLSAICALTYVALAGFRQPKDWLFYGKYQIIVLWTNSMVSNFLTFTVINFFVVCSKF